MILLKKIKNTFFTPHWKNYYIKKSNIIEQNKILKFNKYKNFLLKYLWFLPNFESHKYWCNAEENDKHGYNNYLEPNEDAQLLLNEVTKRSKDKKIKILDLCCNVGRHLNALNKIGYSNLYGVDINKLAIQKMKTIYKNLNSANISYKSAESYLINTKDNFFDLIYTHGATVELIQPTFPIVNEVCRVTKNYVIFLIQENGHAYPRFWRYEFKKNKMDLIYHKDCSGLSLLVYKKNNQNES